MTRPAQQISLTVPVLATGRPVLREPREADFAAMRACNDSPRASIGGGGGGRQWVWRRLPANIGQWVLHGFGRFSVEARVGDCIGRIGMICHDDRHEAELGGQLFDGHEGQGCGVQAVRAAHDGPHARIRSRPPISHIDPENPRSVSLARDPGAAPEREAVFLDGLVKVWRHPAPGGMA